MPFIKLTSIFQLTTVPQDLSRAVAHTGGWSESVWTSLDLVPALAAFRILQTSRATLLPATASIIGYRQTTYDLVNGRFLQPTASQAGRQYFPGVIGNLTDVPQAAIQLQLRSAGGSSSNLMLRGIPDAMIVGGEWAPQGPYSGFMVDYQAVLVSGPWGNVGRDKTQASVRVLGGSTRSFKVSEIPVTGLIVGDYVRFNRVLSSTRLPISGAFRVTSIDAPTGSILCEGNPVGVELLPNSGTVRRDRLVYGQYSRCRVVRAVVKKVGSPFEKYRGRRSKRRAS